MSYDLVHPPDNTPIHRPSTGFAWSRARREHEGRLLQIYFGGIEQKASVSVANNVAEDVMDGIAEVGDYRQLKATSDPLTNELLARAQVNHSSNLFKIQRRI